MGIDRHSRRFRWGLVYVLVVASITTAAQISHSGRLYLAALVLTLPVGLVAIIGVYVAYGLLVQVVTALSSGISADQISDRTFVVTAPVNVALFAGAAVVNLLLLRSLLGSRRDGSAV